MIYYILNPKVKAGVWNLEELNPDPFIKDLDKYGMPVRVIEQDGWGDLEV